MAKSNDASIPRRDFLRGAATLVGASVVGFGPGSALAGVLRAAASGPSLSVGYWDGQSFVAADQLAVGDPTLERVLISIRGYGPGSSLSQIDILPLVSTPKGPVRVSFPGWSAPPQGCTKTQFQMPVDDAGLVTSIHCAGVLIPTSFATGKSAGPKLLEGTYVLAPCDVVWSAYQLDLSRPDAPLVMASNPMGTKAPFQYVVFSIARA